MIVSHLLIWHDVIDIDETNNSLIAPSRAAILELNTLYLVCNLIEVVWKLIQYLTVTDEWNAQVLAEIPEQLYVNLLQLGAYGAIHLTNNAHVVYCLHALHIRIK